MTRYSLTSAGDKFVIDPNATPARRAIGDGRTTQPARQPQTRKGPRDRQPSSKPSSSNRTQQPQPSSHENQQVETATIVWFSQEKRYGFARIGSTREVYIGLGQLRQFANGRFIPSSEGRNEGLNNGRKIVLIAIDGKQGERAKYWSVQ